MNNFVIRIDPNVGKDEGKKRRGWQRMRWLGSLTDSLHEDITAKSAVFSIFLVYVQTMITHQKQILEEI